MDKSLIPKLPTKCKLCQDNALADLWLRKMSEPSPAPAAAHKDRIFHFLRKQDEKDSRRLASFAVIRMSKHSSVLILFYQVLVPLMVFVTHLLVWFSALNYLNNWDRSTLHFTCICGPKMPKKGSLLSILPTKCKLAPIKFLLAVAQGFPS